MRHAVGFWTNQVAIAIAIARIAVIARVPRRVSVPALAAIAIFLFARPSPFLRATARRARVTIARIVIEGAPASSGAAIPLAATSPSSRGSAGEAAPKGRGAEWGVGGGGAGRQRPIPGPAPRALCVNSEGRVSRVAEVPADG